MVFNKTLTKLVVKNVLLEDYLEKLIVNNH